MGWGGGNLGIFCQNIWRDMEGGGGDFLSAIYASESGMGF